MIYGESIVNLFACSIDRLGKENAQRNNQLLPLEMISINNWCSVNCILITCAGNAISIESISITASILLKLWLRWKAIISSHTHIRVNPIICNHAKAKNWIKSQNKDLRIHYSCCASLNCKCNIDAFDSTVKVLIQTSWSFRT